MSTREITIRAASVIKVTDGVLNMDFTAPKGGSLDKFLSVTPTVRKLEQQLAEANARIEMLEKSNEFLKSELEQIARFNPDWDRLEAAYDSIRDHMELTAQLNARIARFEDASNNLINVIPHMDGVFVRDCISDLQKALKESPQQSLALHDADVRAKAIKDFAYNLPFNGDTLTRKDVEGFMGKYIASGCPYKAKNGGRFE